jgi:hypothetical protein
MALIIYQTLMWLIICGGAVWAVKYIAREAIDPIVEKIAKMTTKK